MRTFRWLSANEIPPDIDLRRCGWTLADDSDGSAGIGLAQAGRMGTGDWLVLLNPPAAWQRRSILLAGIDDADERARLIRLGFGEVVGSAVAIAELEARAMRVAEAAHWLPARRNLGALTLKLRERDASINGRALGLHPREFALLWRLAEEPGRIVSKRALLADVWKLGFVPETNSLAVHVFRLRAKLASVGIDGAIRTDPDGGYAIDDAIVDMSFAAPGAGEPREVDIGEEECRHA